MTENNTYKPTNDYVFSRIFGYKRNWELLKDKMEIHYIQLPKFKEKCKRISSKLEEWLTFIINDDMEAVKLIENEFVQKAEDELEYINADEEERMRARFRELSKWNYDFDVESMREYGLEQGKKEGIKEGKKEGIKEGIKEGERKQSIKIAKKMLEKNEKIEYIIELTGLTEKEIKELQN